MLISHDVSGIARGRRKKAWGPAEKERNPGNVKNAAVRNWTKVIRGPRIGKKTLGWDYAKIGVDFYTHLSLVHPYYREKRLNGWYISLTEWCWTYLMIASRANTCLGRISIIYLKPMWPRRTLYISAAAPEDQGEHYTSIHPHGNSSMCRPSGRR